MQVQFTKGSASRIRRRLFLKPDQSACWSRGWELLETIIYSIIGKIFVTMVFLYLFWKYILRKKWIMKPVPKWASIGAALAFVQYFIFNGTHQNDWTNRIAIGLLGIVMWTILGVVVGLGISFLNKRKWHSYEPRRRTASSKDTSATRSFSWRFLSDFSMHWLIFFGLFRWFRHMDRIHRILVHRCFGVVSCKNQHTRTHGWLATFDCLKFKQLI